MEKNNQTKKKRRWGPVSIAVFVVALAVLVFSLYQLINILLEYKRGNDEYAGLEDTYTRPAAQEPYFDVDFALLKQENPDIVAWIYFPNMNINYPVMQGEDNDFYLNHTFKKEANKNGSIFMDYMNQEDFGDTNTLVYGHNMKSGAMFGNLKKFNEESYYHENSYFYIFTPEHGSRKYDIFSYYNTRDLDSYMINFAGLNEYREYLDTLLEKSLYETGVQVNSTDAMVTLVTCTSGPRDERFVVHAKLLGAQNKMADTKQ